VKNIVRRYFDHIRNDVPWIGASEVRLASLMIGIVEIMWSMTGIVPPIPNSIFSTTLHQAGLGDEWFASMMMVGIITTAGSLLPWRSGRHIGLFLSSIMWAVMTGIFIDTLFSAPVVAAMPVFSAFAIGVMYADAKRKPREKLDS